MNRTIKYIITLIIALTAYSCVKQDREQIIAKQEENIDKYVSRYEERNRIERLDGSNRIVLEEGSKDTVAAEGDSVYFIYAGYVFNTGRGEIFATNSQEIADKNSFIVADTTDTLCGKLAGDPTLIPGLAKGLIGVGLNEHCEIVFSAKEGYYKHPIYNVPKMSALLFEVWVKKIVKQKKETEN